MSFSLEYALANAERLLSERKRNHVKRLKYVLYYANNNSRYDGKVEGYTIPQLMSDFRKNNTHRIAFITKIGSDDVLRYYNVKNGSKFTNPSATRTRKSK